MAIMQGSMEQTPQELQKLRNNRTGLFLFQLSWILVFISLIAANLLIRGNFESWPPPGIERLGIGIPAVATVALIVSSVLAHRGYTALQQGNVTGLLSQFRATMALGAVFVAIMAFEWLVVPVTGQYSTIFRVMTAFHGFHALVIGLYVWRTYRFAKAGMYDSTHSWGVEAAVKLWDFVTVAWLLFFTVLYMI